MSLIRQLSLLLAKHFSTSVIPASIHGTREALSPGKFFPRPHTIHVVLGKPLEAGELKREGRGEKPHEQIANALQESVAKLGQGDGNSP